VTRNQPQHRPEVRHAAPQVVLVSVNSSREFRRLADPDLSPEQREALCREVAPALDHLISRAEEAAWSI
jgi:hypothetical protein